ncbi:hypothetical protein [Cephaloticoccus primus]|uniref:hypothetical protein n=1 Tax=Cephaloticoccus primus TaxID=1548207 RepID=UPI0012E95F6E|nr:hypothetical protein [Cephaloticoccus primus]
MNVALTEYENKRRDAARNLTLANRKREREEWAAAAVETNMKRAAINSITSDYDRSTAISREAS